jgi:Protein of unknown function (DUF3325)
MAEIALTLAAALLSWAGFGLLALRQERYAVQFFGPNSAAAQSIPAAAATVFIAACAGLSLCVAAHGTGFGCLLWGLLQSASAFCVALQLTWQSPWLKPIARLDQVLFRRAACET